MLRSAKIPKKSTRIELIRALLVNGIPRVDLQHSQLILGLNPIDDCSAFSDAE